MGCGPGRGDGAAAGRPHRPGGVPGPVRGAYEARPGLVSLPADERFAEEAGAAQDGWREVAAAAARRGVPTPGFSAALAHDDALRTPRLPAALTQGQRDFFGAHTYRRTDREGAFHTLWGGDRSEVEADRAPGPLAPGFSWRGRAPVPVRVPGRGRAAWEPGPEPGREAAARGAVAASVRDRARGPARGPAGPAAVRASAAPGPAVRAAVSARAARGRGTGSGWSWRAPLGGRALRVPRSPAPPSRARRAHSSGVRRGGQPRGAGTACGLRAVSLPGTGADASEPSSTIRLAASTWTTRGTSERASASSTCA